MFEQTFVPARAKTGRTWIVAASLGVQCLLVAGLFLYPLLHPGILRIPETHKPLIVRTWLTQPPPQALPQRANIRTAAIAAPVPARPFVYIQPSAQHSSPNDHVEIPTVDYDASAAWAGPVGPGLGTAFADSAALPPRVVTQPVKPPAPKPALTGPLHVSEGVEGAKLIFSPHPEYSPIAKTAHVEGVVRLQAVIGADGKIRDLHTVSGPVLLVPAAIEAVRQWRYQPTLLNGVAVEVITEIQINFTLTR